MMAGRLITYYFIHCDLRKVAGRLITYCFIHCDLSTSSRNIDVHDGW
jgi:hypothetical protein